MPEEFIRGEGTDALPQGEATQLNEAMQEPAKEPALAPSYGGSPAPEGVEFKEPKKMPGPAGEEESFLFGPSGTPDKGPYVSRNEVPEFVWQAIPALLEAAQNPDAPAAVRVLISMLNKRIEGRTAAGAEEA